MSITPDWLKNLKQRRFRCPKCSDEVFAPSLANDKWDGDPETLVVWCSDSGHWVGFLPECVLLRVKTKEVKGEASEAVNGRR